MKTLLYTLFLSFYIISFANDGLIDLNEIANEKAKAEEAAKQKKAQELKRQEERNRRLTTEVKTIESTNTEPSTPQKEPKTINADDMAKIMGKQHTPPKQEFPVGEYLSLVLRYGSIVLLIVVVAIKYRSKSSSSSHKQTKKKNISKPKKENTNLSKTTPPKSTPPTSQSTPTSSNPNQSLRSPRPSQTLPSTTQGNSIAALAGSPEYIKENTALDDKGRNPSGIVIDEDKYFDGDASSFVDEDFQK